MVGRFFPEGTRMSRPKGGYLLWLEVPGRVDTLKIQREALERGITLAPGRVFSNASLYSSFMRLNYSYPWMAEVESAVKTLGLMSASTSRTTR
jgi:DNA-binding transcriptional MocR family regulator